MSKFNIGVGDDFPLDEDRDPREHQHHGRHHFHGHHHHRGFRHHGMAHHGGFRRSRGFGGLATLLILTGLAALFVQQQLTATAAWGLVAVGAALILIRAVLHWRFHRVLARQAS